jgi:hypothetical protein
VTVNWWSDDDELFADLREALGEELDAPSRLAEVAKSAYAWQLVDIEQTALSDESLVDIPVAVPAGGEHRDAHELRLAGPDFTLHLRVFPTSLLGTVAPPQRGDVEVYEIGASPRTCPVDDEGRFTIVPGPRGCCRLLFRADEGTSAVTDWLQM